MKFSHLRASIENNAEEEPSIYMAICMIESLLEDIEDATGQEVGDWPIGDVTLPTKLVWLCQVINQIYQAKSGELVRNRPRLDAAMKELEKAGAELEKLSGTAVRLSEANAELKKRQAALARAKGEREEYERVKEECGRLQREAESLRGFDKAAEEAKLRSLRAETADMARARAGLEAERADVMAAWNEAVEKNAALRSEIEQARANVEQKKNALSGLEKQRQDAQTRRSELSDRLHEATAALSGLQDAVSRLETETVPERKRQRDDEEARKAGLEQKLASLELETRQLLEKNQELSAEIEKAKEVYNARYSAYSDLTEDCKRKNEEITALEQRLEDLKGITDAQKHEIYKRQIAEQISDLEKAGQECAAMEEELRELDRANEAKKHEAEELNKKKAQAEDRERRIAGILLELEPIASEDFAAKLERNRQRLELLETVRGNLSGTLSEIQEILGIIPADDNGVQIERMKGALQGFLNYTDKLQDDLVKYAKSVRLEESK